MGDEKEAARAGNADGQDSRMMNGSDSLRNFEPRQANSSGDRGIPRGLLPTEHEDSFTVLKSRLRRLAKRRKATGEIDDYEGAKHFDAAAVDVGSLDAVHGLLAIMVGRPDCALVPGAIAPDADRRGMRRLAHRDRCTGDGATLLDVPRRLCALDLDTVPCPDTFDRRVLPAAAERVRNALPHVFRGAACVGLATGSYGFKPGLRFRLFFRLARALSYAELKTWLRREGASVDFAPMHAAGLNYTAAPVFENPSDDPLPDGRLVQLGGEAEVTPPGPEVFAAWAVPRRPSYVEAAPTGGGHGLLVDSLIRVRQAKEGGRHNSLVHESVWLARFVVNGTLNEADTLAAITRAAEEAWGDSSEVASVWRWALARKTEDREAEASVNEADGTVEEIIELFRQQGRV